MLHGSASDEATIGTYLRMGQPETTDAVRRQLQLLLVGGSEEEFASLHELLVGTSNGPLRLEHAASPEDVLNQLGKEDYHLLPCSNQSTDNVAFQVLPQVRQHVSGIPLIFPGDRVNKDAIEVPIQSIAGDQAAQSQRWDAYATHAGAFECALPGTPACGVRGNPGETLAFGERNGGRFNHYGSIRCHGICESSI
jgi:hypothetical protein